MSESFFKACAQSAWFHYLRAVQQLTTQKNVSGPIQWLEDQEIKKKLKQM